jgi:hypothetical protein
MGDPSPHITVLEERWRRRLKDAELRLTFARQYFKEVQADFPPPAKIRGADGRYAFQRALQAEMIALANYKRVLEIFTDLVLRGTIPNEDL